MGAVLAWQPGLRRAARLALDLVLPPCCLSCRQPVGEPGTLCGGCWSAVAFLAPPCCCVCGHPFDFDLGPDALCAACTASRPAWDRARAVARYDDASRPLLVSFKHRDRTDAAPAFGRWMARAGAELLAEADLLVPVPLHRFRLMARRYNQSALLARAIAAETGLPCAADLLLRTRRTRSQGRMTRDERERNVRGAFAVRDGRRAALRGRRAVLIDDVLTTGATAAACTAALLRACAAAVDVLTLARVVRAGA